MESATEGGSAEGGIWVVGVIIEASFLPQLKKNPMKLIKPSSAGKANVSGVVCVCKLGSLNTYQYVNDYSTGCTLHQVDQSSCQYPSLLQVPLLGDSEIDSSAVLAQLGLSRSDLQVVAGLPQKTAPTVLLASQHFMESYGFYTREQVWFRWSSCIPLESVVLTIEKSLLADVEQSVVTQFFKDDLLVLQRGFNYVVPIPAKDFPEAKEVGVVHVMDCSPVLQGLVTSSTQITVSTTSSHTSRKRRSLRDRKTNGSQQEVAGTEESMDCVIEAVCVPSYRLPSHYIILPKEFARKYSITDCQSVWVEAHSPDSKRVTKLSDVTVTLHTTSVSSKTVAGRRHRVIVFLYEVEFELEQYIPPYLLGSEYDTTAMTMAYLHPQLLFFLFPETLSPSRHFFIRMKRFKAGATNIKTFSVKEVASPVSRDNQKQENVSQSQSQSAVMNHFKGRSVFLSLDEVFRVVFDSGAEHYFVVCAIGSEGNEEGILDAGPSSWHCDVAKTEKMQQSYVPDTVPPSSLFPDRTMFESISPSGLSKYTEKLFSFLLPAFTSSGSTKPLRYPSVLINGPPGVGKHTVVKAVARQCRLHLVELNCHEFTNDVIPVAEAKFRNAMEIAISYNPVVVVLNNIHMLGRKGNHEEPRMCAILEAFLGQVSRYIGSANFPILIIGITSRQSEVSSRIQALFLHQLEMVPPSQEERLSMLKCLSKTYHLSLEVDLTKLAQISTGFLFADFVHLFNMSYDMAVSSIFNYCDSEGCEGVEDVAVSGVVLTQHYLSKILSHLQATQSDAIGAPKIPQVKWDDIGGLMEAKKEILDTIQLPLQYPHLFGSNLRRSGLLLYGAPGTGKTLLAKAVATECSLTFLSVKGPELINMYVGQSEENIREVFSQARKCAPCIVFFDELDSIAPNRGRSSDSGGVMDRVVSQLLAELDGHHEQQDVFIIGATNRPDMIDPALLRPGRFDRLVYLGVNEDSRSKEKILKAITRKFDLAEDVDFCEISKLCPPIMTGADLYGLSSDAMLRALRRAVAGTRGKGRKLVVERSDFMSSLGSFKPSISPAELDMYKNIQVSMVSS